AAPGVAAPPAAAVSPEALPAAAPPAAPAAAPPAAAARRLSRSAYRSRCCFANASLLCSSSSRRPRSWRTLLCTSSRCWAASTWFATMRSMRVMGASRSFNFSCTGSASGGVLAQPPASVATHRASRLRRMGCSSRRSLLGRERLRQIHDLDAPVFRPGRLIVSGCRGALLAVTHGGDLRVRGALQQQRAAYRLCAPLAEPNVVLA